MGCEAGVEDDERIGARSVAAAGGGMRAGSLAPSVGCPMICLSITVNYNRPGMRVSILPLDYFAIFLPSFASSQIHEIRPKSPQPNHSRLFLRP